MLAFALDTDGFLENVYFLGVHEVEVLDYYFSFSFFFQCENFPILSTGKLPTFPHTDLYEMTSSFFYLNHCTLTIFAVPKGLMLFSSAKSQIIYI